MAISQSGSDRDFFSFVRARATFLCARKVAVSSRVFLTGRAASSSYSPPVVVGAAATTRITLVASAAAVLARRMRPIQVPGSSFYSARTLSFHGSGRLLMHWFIIDLLGGRRGRDGGRP